MKIGLYSDGRALEYNETTESFEVSGLQVSRDQVIAWGDAGQLTWETDELRKWVQTMDLRSATAQQVEPPRAGWFKSLPTWVKVAGAAVAVLVVIAAASSRNPSSADQTAASTSKAPQTAAVQATPASADQAPVEQAASTDAPTTDPAAPTTVQEAVDSTFGTFSPVTKSGRGSGVVKLPADLAGGLVVASASGSSNFAIWSLDDSNGEIDLLVNTIGKYKGTTFLSGSDTTPVKLKVEAQGAWKITVLPVSSASEFSTSKSGHGDAVLLYSGPDADLKITHRGRSNFAVKLISTDGTDLLVNEIGNYGGTIPVSAGPGVFIIEADGNWTIRAE
jgi:hypothetical protein